MIIVVRSVHSIFALFFLGCIGYIYYCALTDQVGPGAFVAAGALILEGLAVLLSGRRCPLEYLHERYGDKRRFFDLFLPKSLVPYAYPSLVATSVLGIMLLLF